MTGKVGNESSVPSKNPYEHLRRTPRFKASAEREMNVVIERAAGCQPREVRGKVLDLSLGGAKLSVPSEIDLQEKVSLRWDVEQLEVDFFTAATVCWARTESANCWRLGCSFEKQLPDALISQLAVHGYIDRREGGRDAVAIHASVQWELTQETVPVRLNDVSAGGFSLVSADHVPTGSRCRLILPSGQRDPVVAGASVEWQRKTADGYMLGCAYLEKDAHRAVDRAIALQLNGEVARPADSPAPAPAPRVPAAATSRATGSATAADDLPSQVARAARSKMLAAMLAMGAAMFLVNMTPSGGKLAWCGAMVAFLVAAAWTNSYHQLTSRVRAVAAEEMAGNR
jgi:c-di-GMP-binding flagellar brake protein YcgR